MKVLGIYGSPRKEGNTSLLLKEFLKGARTQGASISEIFVCDKHIMACVEDYTCARTGICCLQDDMQHIYPQLIEHELIAVAAPIFFYSINAQTKALIDRCQAFWARKYILKQPLLNAPASKKGVFISAGATKGAKLFDGALLTMKYFFDVLDARLYESLLFRNIEAPGEIAQHPSALKDAYLLGQRSATPL